MVKDIPTFLASNFSNVTNHPSDLCDKIKKKVACWAVEFNIPSNALNSLLLILRQFPGLTELAKDSRSVLKTRNINETACLSIIQPGVYHHFGLIPAIRRHFT